MPDPDLIIRILLVVHTVGTTVIGIILFFWTRNTSDAVEQREVVLRLEQLEKRFDRAGQKTSDLATRVQCIATKAEINQMERIWVEHTKTFNVVIGDMSVAIARIEERLKIQDRNDDRND